MAKEDVIRQYLATIGAAGGSKTGKKGFAVLTAKERSTAAREGVKARWEQYYRDNPEKLRERKAREKKRAAK
jgi:hypothetical protein